MLKNDNWSFEMAYLQQLEKGKCFTHLPRSPKEQNRKLWIDQPCFGPEESHGTSVLEWYLWAHEGEGEWKQSAWIHQGSIVPNLPYCIL